MTKPIVVIGSYNTDMVVQAPRIPTPGETILGGTFSMVAGGKGANQAVAAARCGGAVSFIARLGDDMFGHQAIAGLKADSIDTSHVACLPDVASGTALITVSEDGENAITVASGANALLMPDAIETADSMIAEAAIVLTQLETPLETISALVDRCAAHGVPLVLNPAPALPLNEAIFSRVAVLTPNESEAELLSGVPVTDLESAKRAGEVILAKGVKTLIITMGGDGALLFEDGSPTMVPSFTVDPVDTTGAGDTFNGALCVAISEGKSWAEAVTFANAAAALSVTVLGAQPSAPRRADVDALVQTHTA
ncbi:MAG: ribokinase [Pseudomonadota bacterium]